MRMDTRVRRVLPWLCGILFGAMLLPPVLAQNTGDDQNQQNGNPNRRNRQNGNGNRQNGNRNGRQARIRPGLEVIQKTLPNAQIQPGAIQEIKRQPIPFKPFPIMDPQTRQPAARSAQITLPDGRKVPAGEYYDQLNALEADLNKRGFSLKTKQKNLILQQTTINRQQITAQGTRIAALHKPAPLTPMVKFKAAAPHSPIAAQLQRHVAPEDAHVFGLQPNEYQTALTHLGSLNLKVNGVGNLYQSGNIIQNGIKNGTFPLPIKIIHWLGPFPTPPPPTTINYSYPFNWSVGSQSTFEAYLRGSASITGTVYQVSNPPDDGELRSTNNQVLLHGDATAGGAIFNQNIDILSGSADFSASNQQCNAKMDISVLGQSIFSLNESDPNSWNQSNQISKGIDYHTTVSIQITILTLNCTVGASGEVGIQYSVSLASPLAYAAGSFGPYVQANTYAQAGIGVGWSWLGAEAGVGGNMTLMKYSLDVEGQVGLLWFINYGLFEKLQITDTLDLLSGHIYVYAQVNHPCFPDVWDSCSNQVSHDLWNWPGFQTTGTL